MTLADILRQHWPDYVVRSGGPAKIASAHWRAVEAVLSCGTSRLGGHVYRCKDCGRDHYGYHSCNHRSCPRCGARDQQVWASRQQARLLPVPYFMITFTVPEAMRGFFLRHDKVAYKTLFAAASEATRDLFGNLRHFGGEPGFVAVLHTWTRQMLYHPHLHLVVPAVALAPGGCDVMRPAHPEYLLPHQPLADRFRNRFLAILRDRHPGLAELIDAEVGRMRWNVNLQQVGSGKTAVRYLAAYVARSAFTERRLDGYDDQGRIRLWWRDSSDGRSKLMKLEPHEFIRRWLLHVLPKGFTRVRHYGFLSAAARKAFKRVRFLLGCGRLHIPDVPLVPVCCPHCEGPLERLRKIQPVRGPPLSAGLLHAT